jgi:hypothetical protein
MPFGKYKGIDLEELPLDYLQWLRGIAKAGRLQSAINVEIARRATERHYERTYDHEPPRRRDPLASAEVRRLALEIVTRGYRAAALEHHPDHGGDTEQMKLANAAADALRELLGGRP